MNVIGIVGYPACGKGEFSRIAADHDIPVIVMGDIIRQKTRENNLPLTDENIGNTARALRQELGMDAVAILAADEAAKYTGPVIIIDGIRGDDEVRYFRSVFEQFVLIFIKAEFTTRLFRMQSRGRSDDTITATALHIRDRREESFGLARAVDMADLTLENEQGRDDLEAEILRVLGTFT